MCILYFIARIICQIVTNYRIFEFIVEESRNSVEPDRKQGFRKDILSLASGIGRGEQKKLATAIITVQTSITRRY
jgi:hypothetical protein